LAEATRELSLQQTRDVLTPRLTQLIVECRNRRQSVEQEWLDGHAAWSGKAIKQQYKSDLFHYYVPQARRSIERTVSRMLKMLLPKPSFFEVIPANSFDPMASQQAAAVQAYLLYLNRKKVKIRRLTAQLARNLLMYSVSVVKTTVDVYDAGVPEIWPRSRAVDPFAYYIYPETALDIEDQLVKFEDHMMPWTTYQSLVQRNVAEPLDRAQLGKPEWPTHLVTRLSQQGIGVPSDVPEGDQQSFLALTEVWFKSQNTWFQCWIVWNHSGGHKMVMGPRRSAYGEPPYREAFARPLVNQTYTNSMMQDIESLQVWLNDAVNEMEDARTVAAFPPVAIDKSRAGKREQLKYGPRRIWDLPPDAVKQMEIPDTSQGSLRVMQVIMSLLNSVSGSSPGQEGAPQRGMPRAGFAVNNMLQLQMIDIEDPAEIIEEYNLEPMLADQYKITKVFVPPQQIIKIPRTESFPAQPVQAQDLFGDYSFEWQGSMAGQDGPMQAQQLITLAQILMQGAPALQQAGYTVGWADLIREIWRKMQGERNLNQIIRQMTPQEKQQMMLQQLMMQQQSTGQGPKAPGTAEDFTRQQSRSQQPRR
jgi:hypothetical protein